MHRDAIRDEAIACAKAWCHPEVDERHILFAVAQTTEELPDGLTLEAVKGYLQPAGRAIDPPTMSESAEAVLAGIDRRTEPEPLISELVARSRQLQD